LRAGRHVPLDGQMGQETFHLDGPEQGRMAKPLGRFVKANV
jgi:hypothetical protein